MKLINSLMISKKRMLEIAFFVTFTLAAVGVASVVLAQSRSVNPHAGNNLVQGCRIVLNK